MSEELICPWVREQFAPAYMERPERLLQLAPCLREKCAKWEHFGHPRYDPEGNVFDFKAGGCGRRS